MNHTSILYTKRYFPVIGEHGSDGVGYEDHVWFSFIIAEEYGRKIQVITERTYAFGNILLAIISLFVLKHIFNQFCSVKKKQHSVSNCNAVCVPHAFQTTSVT